MILEQQGTRGRGLVPKGVRLGSFRLPVGLRSAYLRYENKHH